MSDFIKSLKTLILNNASDKIFSEKLTKIKYTNTPSKQIKYFFTTIDQYYPWDNPLIEKLKPQKTYTFNFDSIDIEHIYPQKPKVEISTLNSLCHDIGNLTILGPEDNRKRGFSNNPFSNKKSVFKKSSILENRKIAEYPEWNKKNLEKRRRELVKYALKVFSI
ncbi:MAG: hypothetical protein A4E34_02856 [Methanoregula sp. PtaU1.Bin006]|uniref:HNH endonuclease family protein n=1 Tax=Methanoregula sp. PtaU1.Bin006 TaxID=1811681 RepID=UPI0009CAD0B8|nr:HNH endonuclease family protein [Methanoregula sp. PtaU1.Bin006]OPY31663.1 MAG: hypothetical protein A4E34_02856 [Methanoregula sp. PtaU1.Bin006]